MAAKDPGPTARRPALIDREVRRIVNARSVTVGLAVTFLGLAFLGAITIRILDHHDFSSMGEALWWALQTVTTVGYGDVVPTTRVGQLVGAAVMVFSISFVAFLTAGVTSTVIQREQAGQREPASDTLDAETIVDALADVTQALNALDKRLERIESQVG